jgi:D-methionine transport system ATP-binding protein
MSGISDTIDVAAPGGASALSFVAARTTDRTAYAATPGTDDVAHAGPVVRLVDVSKRFGAVVALDGISLEVNRGEILGIIGRSGAGKSTLIRCLNGLERPDSGKVEILGRDFASLSERQLQPLRGRIGMIFQHFNLLSANTVAENVALPLKIAGRGRAERLGAVAELLDLVGLSDKAKIYPAKLSGGQKQRVGIARALAAGPALLLSDEATSALDPETTSSILALLRDINRRLGLTIVLITHEMSVIRAIADRVVVLEHGRIVEEGPVWRVFATPEAELTQRLLGSAHPDMPDFLKDRLRPQWKAGSGLVFRIDSAGPEVRAPILAELAQTFGVRPTILHGLVHQIQHQPVASVIVGIADAAENLAERVRLHLASRVTRLELMGYVDDLA